MQDCMNTRNRFNPENRFIGDIEDGKRYPFGVYTKEESDEKYAIKQTEADLVALAEAVGSKADEQECVDIRARLDLNDDRTGDTKVAKSGQVTKAITQIDYDTDGNNTFADTEKIAYNTTATNAPANELRAWVRCFQM